jgi:hypothetical protein
VEAFGQLIENKALADFILEYSWTWPIGEIVHFIGLSLLIGAIGLIDLRILGVAKNLPLGPLHRLVPWGIAGFALCLVTGIMFVTGDSFKAPVVYLENGVFQVKMLFVLIGGLNAILFYTLPSVRTVLTDLGPGEVAPTMLKAMAGTSLVAWLGVTYLGRMLPYKDAFYFVFWW